MYLGDAGALGAFARARALAESIDDPFNLACAETGQGHLQVSLGPRRRRLRAPGGGQFEVGGVRVWPHVREQPGCPGRGRTAARRPAQRPAPSPGLHLAVAEKARPRGGAGPAGRSPPGPGRGSLASGRTRWPVTGWSKRRAQDTCCGRSTCSSWWPLRPPTSGAPPRRARLLGAAESQREATGYRRWAPARDELAPVLVAIQTALGQQGFEQARLEGRALTLEEAVAYARRGRGSHSRAVSGWDSLTPTERRVVSLVAKHLSNAEIAAQLFVSTVTVKSHLTRVFRQVRRSGPPPAGPGRRRTSD